MAGTSQNKQKCLILAAVQKKWKNKMKGYGRQRISLGPVQKESIQNKTSDMIDKWVGSSM